MWKDAHNCQSHHVISMLYLEYPMREVNVEGLPIIASIIMSAPTLPLVSYEGCECGRYAHHCPCHRVRPPPG
jgi:hypothetical protein